MQLHEIITALREAIGSKAKLALLQENKGNTLLETFLFAAYNPELSYFFTGLKSKEIVSKDPNSQKVGMANFFDGEVEEKESVLTDALTLMNFLAPLYSRQKRGNEARQYVIDTYKNESAENVALLQNIFARDIRAGVSTKTINKVWPKLIPEYPYMRCDLIKNLTDDDWATWNWEKGVYVQLKYDGMFVNLFVRPHDESTVQTRAGTFFPKGSLQNIIDEAEKALRTIPTDQAHVIHGELEVYENGEVLPREVGNGLMNTLLQEGEIDPKYEVRLRAWDLLLEHEYNMGITDVTYEHRFADLGWLLEGNVHVTIAENDIVYSLEEAFSVYQRHLLAGREGAVLKNPNGIWKDGTSRDQLKMKLEVDIDLLLVDLNDGKGRNEETFGSARCVSSCGVVVANVAGMPDKIRNQIYDNFEQYVNKLIITVRSNFLLKPNKDGIRSLFLPRLIELRFDKTEADDLARIEAEFESAIQKVIK